MKILFVCTGNTCRSPMAAALMNKLASENDMDVMCESAGIYASENEPASENAIIAMQDYGADLTEHNSKIIALAGGVASNSDLRSKMTEWAKKEGIDVIYPSPIYCTDNAAMIAAAGYYEFLDGKVSELDLNAVPSLQL